MGYTDFGRDFSQISSFSGDGLVATTYEDDYFVRGNSLILNNVETLAGETTKNFLLDFSGLDAGKRVFAVPFVISTSAEQVTITFYEDTDYAGGTTVTPLNPNRTSTIVPQTVITTGATGSDLGDMLTIHIAFAAGQGVNLTSGTTASRPLIFDTTKKYIIVLENLGNADTIIEYDLVFFEV